MKKNKNKNTLNAVIIVLVLTLATKLLGFIRDAFIGSHFATGIKADAYMMAQRLTVLIFMAVGTAITVSIVPIITRYYSQGESERANQFVNKVLTFFLMLTIGVSIVAVIFAEQITTFIASGYSGERLELTINFVKILFPSIIFIFSAYAIRAVLQSKEHFIGYSVMSVPFNIFIIGYLVFFVERFDIYGLIVSILIAWVFQFFVQLPFTTKDKIKYRLNFRMIGDKDMKEFFILFFPAALSGLIYVINTIIDSSFASHLAKGHVAALGYGAQMYGAIAQTLIYSISAVLFPKLVGNFSQKSFDEFKEDAKNIINNIFYLILPALFGCVALSRPFVELTFMRKNFTVESADLTQAAFVFFSIGFIGFALQEIISKIFFSIKNTIIPTIVAVLSVGLNYILNSILIETMGISGLALATSIAITFNAVLMYILFQIKYGKWNNLDILINATKILIASLLMYLCVNNLIINLHKVIAIDNNFVYNLISIILAGLVGVVVYAAATYILRVKQTEDIIKKLLRQ